MPSNYSGVIPFYRQEFRDRMCLKDSEFRLWWVMISLCGWDFYNNPHLYGRVIITMESLAEYIGWSYDKVVRILKSLLKVKDINIIKTEENTYECLDFDKYLINNAYQIVKEETKLRKVKARQDATLHREKLNEFAKILAKDTKLHVDVSKIQSEQGENPVVTNNSNDKALMSSKVSLVEENYEDKKKRYISYISEEDLEAPCIFCNSGLKLIDCDCSEALYVALKGLYAEQ